MTMLRPIAVLATPLLLSACGAGAPEPAPPRADARQARLAIPLNPAPLVNFAKLDDRAALARGARQVACFPNNPDGRDTECLVARLPADPGLVLREVGDNSFYYLRPRGARAPAWYYDGAMLVRIPDLIRDPDNRSCWRDAITRLCFG